MKTETTLEVERWDKGHVKSKFYKKKLKPFNMNEFIFNGLQTRKEFSKYQLQISRLFRKLGVKSI